MNTNINILSETNVPVKHLLNDKDYEIGVGAWSNGEEFYAFRKKKENNKEENGKN